MKIYKNKKANKTKINNKIDCIKGPDNETVRILPFIHKQLSIWSSTEVPLGEALKEFHNFLCNQVFILMNAILNC